MSCKADFIYKKNIPKAFENQGLSGDYFLYFLLVEMLFNKLEHYGSQKEDTDKVGNCHKAVEGIADAPYETKVNGSAYDGNKAVCNIEG